MYVIVSNSNIVALCDKPCYVKVKPQSGALIETDAEQAEAVSVKGTLYSLPNKPPFKDAPQATVSLVDGATFMFDNFIPASQHAEDIAALEYGR